jgi:hypothetical protein
LIRTEEGHITPFGVVYDNGMQLEQIYDGRHFPEYLHDDPLMTMEVVEQQESSPVTPTWLHLPMSQRQIERALQRAGIQSVDADYEITGNTLPPHIAAIAEHSHDGINLLNRMCRAISVLDDEDRRKLDAAVDFAKSASASEITHFAENLDQVYDYEKYGQQRMERESGAFTEQGYIAYRGTLPIDERMAEAPPEQGFQLGGMM